MKKLNILWIEDENVLLKQMVVPLQKDEHEVIPVKTASEAKHQLEKYSNQKKSFDCIILDLIIPTGDPNMNIKPEPIIGIELLDDIIKKYNFPNNKIVVFTVIRDSNLIARVRKYEIYEIIHKGIYLPSKLKSDIYKMMGIILDN